MEKEEMNITPQDIIDKQFRVKFRGFDTAEVDAFLEEVAESYFMLTEENTLLNEKVLALQQDLENAGSMPPQGQFELPPELGNILEDLKQDTLTISGELAALKQDRQTFDFLKEKLEKVLVSVQESTAVMTSQPQGKFPADLAKMMQEFKQNSGAIAGELAALKESRQAFDSLKKSFAEVIDSAKKAAATLSPRQGHAEIPADLGKTLEGFKQGSETIGAELAALKQKVEAISGMREEIKGDLREQLASHFAGLDAKLLPLALKSKAAPPASGEKEQLLTAEIVEEPAGQAEDTRLPDYREDDDGVFAGDELEFLCEDDILDVDKLRNIFQSVLDEGVSDAHNNRNGDDTTADLLFLEDDLFEDDHEPEVSFSLDETEPDKKKSPAIRKPV